MNKQAEIGKEIKDRRNTLGLSIEALSEISGISARTIQRIESGESSPRGHTLKGIADALNCDITELTQPEKASSSESNESLKWINLSALAVLVIPTANLIIPFILWRKYEKTEIMKEVGGRILSFQIVWTIITAIALIAAPFIFRLFKPAPLNTTGAVILTYVIFWFYNIVSILNTAQKIQKEEWQKVHPKVIRLI